MKYFRVAAFVVGLCLFAGALLHAAYCYLISPGLGQPRISCPNPVYDLGTVSAAGQFPCEFTVENRGNRELVIQDVRVSCRDCLEILAFPKEPIPPEGSGVVQVAFSAKGSKGKVNKSLVVRSNDPTRPTFMLRVLADVQIEVRVP